MRCSEKVPGEADIGCGAVHEGAGRVPGCWQTLLCYSLAIRVCGGDGQVTRGCRVMPGEVTLALLAFPVWQAAVRPVGRRRDWAACRIMVGGGVV